MSSLPIKRRGNFFKDAYFEDFHNDFENAMDKVMDKFAGRSLLADQFTTYRKLKRENSEMAGAASISDTGDNYIIILDMSDFLSGSITVSTSGKNAVIKANVGSKKFDKKFPLPNSCNIDGVTSAMSDEGILTINAPKKESKGVQISMADNNTEQMSKSNWNSKIEVKIPNKSEKGNITAECLHLTDDNHLADTDLDSTSETPKESRRVSIDRRGNFFQDSKFENIWDEFEKSMEDMMQKEKDKNIERNAEKVQRRAQRDAIFDKLTKQFVDDISPNTKQFFERETVGISKEKWPESEKKKEASFEEDLNNIREHFFSKNCSKSKDKFFDDAFSKRKENFFAEDFSAKKDNFFDKSDTTRIKDNFFNDNSIKRSYKLFDDDSAKRKEAFLDKDFLRKDMFFKNNSPSKNDTFYNDDFARKKDNFFSDESSTKTDSLFEEDSAGNRDDLMSGSDKTKNKSNKEDCYHGFFQSDVPEYNRFRKYRNLRNWDPAFDTQAVSVKQTADNYKIILDAKDVDSNSLCVQAIDDGLVVSGGEGMNSFKRKFSLPGAISFEKVNATLSEDGILIITIPKN